jgi:hypothetical protein
MPITISCPACEKEYRVADEKIGKRLRCKCGEPIAVKPAKVAVGSMGDDSLEANDEAEAAAAESDTEDSISGDERGASIDVEVGESRDTDRPGARSVLADRPASRPRRNSSTTALIVASALSAGLAFACYRYFSSVPSGAGGKGAPSSTADAKASPKKTKEPSGSSTTPAKTWLDVQTDPAEHEVTDLDFMLLLLPTGESLLPSLELSDEQVGQLDVLRREQAEVLQTESERLHSRLTIDPQEDRQLNRQWRNHSFHYGARVAKALTPEQQQKLQAAIRSGQIERFDDDSPPNELANRYRELVGEGEESR